MTALPPAGWYPDPEAGGTAWRWWDGVQWAAQLPSYSYGYGPPQAYGVAPAWLVEKYRAATSKYGNWLRWAMLANLVSFLLLAITTAATFRGRGFDLFHTDQYGQPEISSRFAVLQLVSLPLSLVAYAYIGSFIVWIFQAGKFAEARGWPSVRGRTLGAFSLLIPIVQFWWPYEALRDSYSPGSRSPYLLRWWVFYVIAELSSFPLFIIAVFANAAVIAAAILVAGAAQATAVWFGWKAIADVEAMQRAASLNLRTSPDGSYARDVKKDPTATDEYLARSGRRLDVGFNIDVGELIQGHHVILRGLTLDTPDTLMSSELHYEFVPGLTHDEQSGFVWCWMMYASDDVGTVYGEENGGGFDSKGGAATHGKRDVGAIVPRTATRLHLQFEPPSGWSPPEPWRREIDIDLPAR